MHAHTVLTLSAVCSKAKQETGIELDAPLLCLVEVSLFGQQ